NGAATVASCACNAACRTENQFFTGDGSVNACPSHHAIPFATSERYFASITGLQFTAASGPFTASCTARQYARAKGGNAYMIAIVGSSELNNGAVAGPSLLCDAAAIISQSRSNMYNCHLPCVGRYAYMFFPISWP